MRKVNTRQGGPDALYSNWGLWKAEKVNSFLWVPRGSLFASAEASDPFSPTTGPLASLPF